MKTIFISTGEVSGDLQGALLVTALKQLSVAAGIDLNIVALGGSKMAAAGATILIDTAVISAMGFWESLLYARSSSQVRSIAKQYLQTTPPDIIILIDYIATNIHIGNYAHTELPKVPIFYYIAPQEWVWSLGHKNTQAIVKFTDEIFAIFPGEASYFAERGAKAKFIGHPLVDRVATLSNRQTARDRLGITHDEIAIALIPASRKQELIYILPAIFEAAGQIQSQLANIRFWIPLSRPDFQAEIERQIKVYQLNATLVSENADLVLCAADLAITKCGTVSLELALLNIPQVTIYRVSNVTAWIAKNVLKFSIPYMSTPNLIAMKAIVPELMQDEANPERIAAESLELILNRERRDRMLVDYRQMRTALGETGVCDRVAQEILAKI
ncbi:lipid-A-disaccharide synthase [Chamaesiphon polymorphus]|uniref:Lipid-A-disaccharide synthase n=1 Tax=Chamaesiphon polymorphus CCALA 037 TaxID=2107692 RepID=A0A2T1GIK9_9CYAN|nr:lipid-A-disaccharide synthase [Chamaesiphon polymorphus]PSB57542.1 lipid-A-disaccharide synthase [Chamaesiphon polymorphus CCALA 037]